MSKVLTDQIEKRTGGTAMDVPATGKWPEGNIADDAVTLAKMAGLARGKLIVGDSSGDPSALTVGTADQVLTSDGTDAAWSTLETGTSWQAVKTAAFTAVAGEGYPINTTSAAITVTLPATASVGDTIECIDYARKWGTNAVTINPNSLNYQGNTTPQPVYNTTGESFRIVYVDATQGWVPVFDGAVALETPQNYDIDFLVIAGGGSGGSTSNSGGGGAGGYRTSTQNIDSGVVFTVTVGDGGSASSSAIGVNGSDSSVSGSGLTTITSAGGGGGALGSGGNGLAGGSGIVIISWGFVPVSYTNMTLVSTATTAQAVPTKGDMVMTYTNGAGTAVINTNIKGYVSRDGGTTYTQGTLASQGTTGGHTILSFHDLDISGQPSGSSMRYKIETLVQSTSMDTRIQAVSLGWS